MSVGIEAQVIATCVTKCCREWISPAGIPGGRCGYCNERPTFVRMLPESEWLTPRPPIREVRA